ncbi:MAG: flagellar hook capping FlgD N-terminal domain-containing protein [Gemmataceae bacterium]
MSAISGTTAAASRDQFLQLLIAQLQNQDPLSPVDTKDFTAQLAQLSTVEGLQTLNASFSEMLKLQQLTNGAGLIGKTVSYQGADGTTKTGAVGSLAVENSKVVLVVGQDRVGLDQIASVK